MKFAVGWMLFWWLVVVLAFAFDLRDLLPLLEFASKSLGLSSNVVLASIIVVFSVFTMTPLFWWCCLQNKNAE